MVVNEEKLKEDLNANPEVLSEAIQTVLRKNDCANAYEILKDLTRGKKVSLTDIKNFINQLDIATEDKEVLKQLTPENYIGLADKLVNLILS